MLEEVFDGNELLSIIIRRNFDNEGIQFFTSEESSLQLGFMKRGDGYCIQPHVHLQVSKTVFETQEVLFIKSGVVRVDYYTQEQDYIESRLLYAGDVVFLAKGGHGFKILEEAQILEVKQGPFSKAMDKERFNGISSDRIVIKGQKL